MEDVDKECFYSKPKKKNIESIIQRHTIFTHVIYTICLPNLVKNDDVN